MQHLMHGHQVRRLSSTTETIAKCRSVCVSRIGRQRSARSVKARHSSAPPKIGAFSPNQSDRPPIASGPITASMPHAHDGRRRTAHRAESELGVSAVERTRGRSCDPSVSVCRRGVRQRAAGLQADPAAAPVVTPVLKDPLNHMRSGDIRRRPPAGGPRNDPQPPPQRGQRLRAPRRSIANTRLIVPSRTTAPSACHRDCFTTTVSRRLFHEEWRRSPARLSARLSWWRRTFDLDFVLHRPGPSARLTVHAAAVPAACLQSDATVGSPAACRP